MFLVLVLRQAILDCVIVALFRNENMHRHGRAGWAVENAHGNSRPIVVDRVPK